MHIFAHCRSAKQCIFLSLKKEALFYFYLINTFRKI